MELERRSSGVAKAGLATGITGAALGGLNSLTLLGMGANALGGFCRNGQPAKLIAGITAGTTTTPQPTFNPIPQDNDCCCGN